MSSLAAEVKEKAALENREPKDVLRDLMLFYDTQAKDIIETIIACLEDKDENGKPLKRGDLLALMYKKHSEAADKAIDCATKLAPYKHPKLESVELHKTDTKRFVVVIPAQQLTKEAWLMNATALAPLELPLPVKEQVVTDIEDLGYDIDDIEDCRRFVKED